MEEHLQTEGHLMSPYQILIRVWDPQQPVVPESDTLAALEAGQVRFFSPLGVLSAPGGDVFFPWTILAGAKNASFEPRSDRLSGTTLAGVQGDLLKGLMRRFSDAAAQLVDRLLPRYRGHVAQARASFRPAAVEGRVTSWRKDDTRL